MKTISDIKHDLELINNESKHFSQEAANRAFELFKDVPEIDKLLSNLEDMENGEYSIEDDGMLAYSVEVPSEIADLPFINDYLTQDYAYLTGKKHNDLRLTRSCGYFISIDWNHERNSYFVYDRETNKALIEKRLDWMDEKYVAAVIELYQHKTGCFGDVIEVCSRYGSYEKHFSTFENLGTKSEISEKELQDIINSYHLANEAGA